MFSRLSLYAALFAVVSTASLAVAANVQHDRNVAKAATPIIVFEPVTIIGKRVG
jgi:hypothetical protein